MVPTQDILEYWLNENQFKDGHSKGQFGTNTLFEERKVYHHPENENIYTTPQMFMTYLGTLCLLNNSKKFSEQLDAVTLLLQRVFETGVVLFPHNSTTSQQLDTFHEEKEYLVSYRHTAIGLSNYIVLKRDLEFVERKLEEITFGKVQNEDGGWPLSSQIYVTSDLTTSIYFAHLFELARSLQVSNSLSNGIDNAEYRTLDFLEKEFDRQYENNFNRMLRTIPSFYFLGFESFIRYNNPLLHRIPTLVKSSILDNKGWVKIENNKKVHRYTIRYCKCLFLASLVDTSFYDDYSLIREQVLNNLNYPELNTFEIFALLNFLKDKRVKADRVLKAVDKSLPLLNLIPGLGGVIYSYVERFKEGAIRHFKKSRNN